MYADNKSRHVSESHIVKLSSSFNMHIKPLCNKIYQNYKPNNVFIMDMKLWMYSKHVTLIWICWVYAWVRADTQATEVREIIIDADVWYMGSQALHVLVSVTQDISAGDSKQPQASTLNTARCTPHCCVICFWANTGSAKYMEQFFIPWTHTSDK